jgi:hypothetical protein
MACHACRHIAELYHVKEGADAAAKVTGVPPPDFHAVIWKSYLTKLGSTPAAEEQAVQLVQSAQAHANQSPRVLTFSQLLGLESPGLPAPALEAYLAFSQALRAPAAGASAAPVCVDEEQGAKSWVALPRCRTVVTGALAHLIGGAAASKATLKAVSDIRWDSCVAAFCRGTLMGALEL